MNKKALLIALALSLSACATTPQYTSETRPAHWAQAIHQDANLYQVDNRLYRSEQLNSSDRYLLAQHNIRTILNLRYFHPNEDAQILSPHFPVKLINQPLLAWKVRPADIANALWNIEQQQKRGAVLVHCYHGADRTGIIIAFYRIIYQNWSIEEAKKEMMQGGYGYHPLFKNLERLLTEEKVMEVKHDLSALRRHYPVVE